jgi:hypothetical protein
MDQDTIATLMSTVELIAATLDVAQDNWRGHLPSVRNITATLDFNDTIPDETRKVWQLPLITVFQRVAYADADKGGNGIIDIADWCLRQSLTLLQIYPEHVTLLARKLFFLLRDISNSETVVGRNWLLRAQNPLAKIYEAEGSSSNSEGSQNLPSSSGEEQEQAARAALEAEQSLQTADYVEARGLLLPAVEYFKRAVDITRVQNKVDGPLLATVRTLLEKPISCTHEDISQQAAEAYMSLGNVSFAKVNKTYFHEALTVGSHVGSLSKSHTNLMTSSSTAPSKR